MKKHILSLLTLAMVLSVTSCTVEIREDADINGNGQTNTGTTGAVLNGTGTLTGTLTQNTLVKKGNYTLEGIVKVPEGITLTIEAGATFTAKTSVGSSLVVLQGGKILAEGTASEPIVFTSDNKKPGDWGGVTLYGNAPIKAINGATRALSEDGNNVYYGGDNPNDNSGVLKYVRVEYGGKKIGDGTSETNSMTFYAVGAGTVLENLVSYKGTDDGYEFFGGTVSGKNLVSYGNYDDSFDWQDSWSGQSNSNWFAFQTAIGNFGMEIESSGNADNTAPKINNITLIRETGTKPETAGSIEITAIQFKKHGSGIFSNVYMDGYKNTDSKNAYAVLIQDSATETEQVNKGKIKVEPANHVNSDNLNVWGYAFTPNGGKTFTSDSNVKKVTLTTGNWANVNGVDLLAALK
ncbi:hypothetical protein H0S70_07560 [Chryseobacterium manosquense]|uniref:Multidrug transporter n=2 Tax=Chryseobacterium group TaxID=2782232 RepID=A0A246B8T7_9FLAO|nr:MULTISPECIES: hypothetical protein [Chryseobacterium group]MDN5578545.1 hypothetical protein [Chryseobacterium sp.]OWK97867.1 hypothetical protein AP75_09060 [Kaistella haifensis DSM 19056]QNS40262.1 hypothetical protein H0S70_07560 [Chryseobacterium manosquense]ROI07437.1 hypothetical protein EGH90_05840 [Kaistella haifensis]